MGGMGGMGPMGGGMGVIPPIGGGMGVIPQTGFNGPGPYFDSWGNPIVPPMGMGGGLGMGMGMGGMGGMGMPMPMPMGGGVYPGMGGPFPPGAMGSNASYYGGPGGGFGGGFPPDPRMYGGPMGMGRGPSMGRAYSAGSSDDPYIPPPIADSMNMYRGTREMSDGSDSDGSEGRRRRSRRDKRDRRDGRRNAPPRGVPSPAGSARPISRAGSGSSIPIVMHTPQDGEEPILRSRSGTVPEIRVQAPTEQNPSMDDLAHGLAGSAMSGSGRPPVVIPASDAGSLHDDLADERRSDGSSEETDRGRRSPPRRSRSIHERSPRSHNRAMDGGVPMSTASAQHQLTFGVTAGQPIIVYPGSKHQSPQIVQGNQLIGSPYGGQPQTISLGSMGYPNRSGGQGRSSKQGRSKRDRDRDRHESHRPRRRRSVEGRGRY